MARGQKPKATGTVEVPAWVALVTFFIGWGLGAGVVIFEAVTGDNNIPAYVMGGWLICLPLVAAKPTEVLSHLFRGGDE